MSKICPLTNEKVLYLDCLECDEKACKEHIILTAGTKDTAEIKDEQNYS